MQINIKRILSLLLVAVMLSSIFAGCKTRDKDTDIDEDSSSSSAPDTDSEEFSSEGAESLAALANEMWEQNADTVGWLKVPNTKLDGVVLFKENDNDFYYRRNFEGRYDYNGSYYADMRSIFGNNKRDGIGKNTVIYGHSMSDDKDDVKFGPTRYYLDEKFAKKNPYIYFSTTEEDMVWEVFAVFYTHFDVPYNRTDLTDSEFDSMIKTVRDQSVFDYDVEISKDDKFLTLSTCVYSLPDVGAIKYPSPYRYAVMARLVGPDEKLKKEAKLTVNKDVKSVYKK